MGKSRGRKPECLTNDGPPIQDGTLCLQPSPGRASTGADHWYNSAANWMSDATDRLTGYSKSVLLTILDVLPLKEDSPFSTALLKHYVERSGKPFQLENIPVEWQEWIVKATGKRLSVHKELNPYNSGLFDLRNSLGHFNVTVKLGQGEIRTYVISDVYQFGFKKNDKGQTGRHGFPIGNPSAWQLAAARRLLPNKEYVNPGGFNEKWEIQTNGKETLLLIPQQFLAEQGKPFDVNGSFER